MHFLLLSYIYQCSLFGCLFGIFWEGDEKLDIDFYWNLQILLIIFVQIIRISN